MRRQFPWQAVLGEPITAWAARKRAEGKSKSDALAELRDILVALYRAHHLPPGWTLEDALERAEKTISARWGEQNRALKSYVDEQKTLGVFASKIREAPDGGLFIFLQEKVVDKLQLQPGDIIVLKVFKVKRQGRYAYEYVSKGEEYRREKH